MNSIQKLVALSFIVAFSTVHCNTRAAKDSSGSIAKRGCARLGEVCDSASDCCGRDDPNVGHCVMCTAHGFIIKFGSRRCGCDVTGSVGVDPNTHAIVTDRCDGRDASRTRCITKVAPPGHRYYRGQ